jgi:multiple antibiotic resistance protein
VYDILETFLTFFVVIDPIGTLPLFLAVTKHMSNEHRSAVATKAVIIAGIILVCFVVFGKMFLEHINVRISAFEIAGGIVFFIFGIKMIFEPEEAHDTQTETNLNVAVFPLALPSIASPGAMLASVIQTQDGSYSIYSQTASSLIILFVMFLVWLLLKSASRIYHTIGDTGTIVISKLMGLILVSMAVEIIIEGVEATFHLGSQ